MISENVKIQSFPLGSVKPTDPYCVNALAKEIEYLKSFDPDRVLAGFCRNAGIKTSAEPYGGWEKLLIGGHAMGHYISALSQALVNPGVAADDKKVLRALFDEIIDGLAECQLENGFLWAGQILVPENVEAQFDLVEQGRANEDIIHVAWVPWYTLHKILAGLLAAYDLVGSEKALGIAARLGDWVTARTKSWDEKTRATVLNTEYGGMNEVMYELYSITKDEKYAAAAHAFDEETLFDDILTNRKNLLSGRHANTTIPKIIGALKRYETVGGERYLKVAETFWESVICHHTYHTGGNSEWEHFRDDDTLDEKRTDANCETCNVYNMLKLTKELFKLTGEKKYANYLETAFLNHILGSQNPDTGMTTYFQAMATGYFKVFSSPWEDFWCCTGSGMENFTKLGDALVFGDSKNLLIVSYLPFDLKADGLSASLAAASSPDEYVLKIAEGEKIALSLRVPDWTDGRFSAKINGSKAACKIKNGFADVGSVSKGDVVEIYAPCSLKAVRLCDNENAIAFKYGPWVLAADLGNEDMETYFGGVNVRFAKNRFTDGKLKFAPGAKALAAEPEKYLKKVGPVEFEFAGMRFKPFRFIKHRYGIYWEIED